MEIIKKIKYLFMVSLILFLIHSCCTPSKLASVGVNLKPQHTDCWCWAACTEMISEYYGHRIPQHESCNYVHGTSCTSDCPGACPCWDDYGAYISQIKNNWTHWGFDYKYSTTHLPWGDDESYPIWREEDYVRETISPTQFCGSCPIYAVWKWYGWGGHVVVAYGYAEIGGQQYISYFDPEPRDCTNGSNCSSINGGDDVVTTFQAFVDDKMHHWEDTFYDFKYVGQ